MTVRGRRRCRRENQLKKELMGRRWYHRGEGMSMAGGMGVWGTSVTIWLGV